MTGALAKALVAAQKTMPAVDETGKSNYGAHMTLDHMIAVTLPKLNEHGLALSQFPAVSELGQPVLRTIILHESGETLSADTPLFMPRQDMQALGAAITYARRYAWAAACGITSEKDDDGDSIRERPAQTKSAPKDSARSTPAVADGGAPVEQAAPNLPSADHIAALLKLVEERGGDQAKTLAASKTAEAQGKLPGWYAAALKHWSSQPVASEFEKKAADARKAGGEAQQARAAKAQADRDNPKAAA